MIPTLLHVALTNLRRDRVMLAMIFLLPIVFFSIFVGVFGQQGRSLTAQVRVAVVDEDGSAASARLVAALQNETGLIVQTTRVPPDQPQPTPRIPLDRERAHSLVRDGDLPVAIVIPAGFGHDFESSDPRGPELRLLADTADPVAPQIVVGLLQKVAMTADVDLLEEQDFQDEAGTWNASEPSPAPAPPRFESLIEVRIVDVLGEKKANPAVAFYAGGMAVMFLLFSASTSGGTLLDEVESGTLERLLTSHASMATVLAAKWLFITLLGICQVIVMFVWGMLVFELDLLHHVPGFFVMTGFTAAAAAAFGVVLATLCKSRQQLSGLSTILILTQSALGGSMFPRFLMSEELQQIGLFTFNAWALDGYIEVFWRDSPVTELWPQLAVLTGLTAVFLALARLFARRWETI